MVGSSSASATASGGSTSSPPSPSSPLSSVSAVAALSVVAMMMMIKVYEDSWEIPVSFVSFNELSSSRDNKATISCAPA